MKKLLLVSTIITMFLSVPINVKAKEKTEFEKKAESTLDRLSSLISGQVNDKEKKEEQLASTSKVSGDMWG